MKHSNNSNRILWIDWIKVIAVIGVALIHVCGTYQDESLMFSFNWYISALFDSISRYAVLLFIMASGFLILRKNESISKVPKRFKRICIPFVFWFLIFVGIHYFRADKQPLDIINFLIYTFNGFLDPIYISAIFWFVYMILGLYVFAPILSKWIQNSKIKEIEYFLIIWIIIMLIQFSGVNTIIPDYFRYFGGFVGYFIFGYYLTIKESKYLKSRKFGLLLFIIGTLIAMIGTIVVPMFTGHQTFSTFMTLGDNTPNACLQAIGLYIIIKNTKFEKLSNKINKLAILISLESYGFYLSHILVLSVLVKIAHISNQTNAIIGIPILAIVVIILTNIMIYIMTKIPFFRRFTGITSIL